MEQIFQKYFQVDLIRWLGAEDDPELWRVAIDTIFHDVHYLLNNGASNRFVQVSIGSCSHWLRPHQTRWTADGGFAWPVGYKGPSLLPEYDWSLDWFWHPEKQSWESWLSNKAQTCKRIKSRKMLSFYVTIPSRTMRHNQAVVHTRWTPGSPSLPKKELLQLYGFRKLHMKWESRAVSLGSQEHYD